jgi:hypothetical protein
LTGLSLGKSPASSRLKTNRFWAAVESGESRSGACDSVPCIQKATVHHLARELGYCEPHFRAVESKIRIKNKSKNKGGGQGLP